MNNVQFCHDRLKKSDREYPNHPGYFILELNPKGGRTIAVEVPTIEEFSVLLPSLKNPVPVKIGIAVCSKKDLYNKKVGRELAVSRMKEHKFFVTQEIHGGFPGNPRIIFLYNSELNIELKLVKYPNTNRVYFEGVV